MKQTLSIYQFRDQFMEIRPNNFSYDGLTALFDYLEQLEEDCGIELEFDPIAICCDFSEDTVSYFLDQYDLESLEELEENTTVIYVNDISPGIADNDNSVIIQNY